MNSITRTISAGLLAASVLCGQAQAQGVIVHDPLNMAQLLAQLKQLEDMYTVARNSYQQLQQTVASVQHLNPQIMNPGQALMNDAMRLPGSASTLMPGLNLGTSQSAAAQPFYNQNQYYAPQGNDFAAAEMQRRQVATANLQGEAQTGMTRIAQRLASLTQLENCIQQQPDVTAVAAIAARINAEHLYLANEGNNIQHLQLLQATQAHVDQQRAEQHGREQADQWDQAVSAQAWGN